MISDDRLDQILEDGIPNKILAAMRYSDDTEEVDRERAGYVPDDEQHDETDDSGDEGSPVLYGNDTAGMGSDYAFGVWIKNRCTCRRGRHWGRRGPR
jgi:hypothetical protein